MSDSEEVIKRNEDQEELEIDLDANIPLSKRQQRLLKKGKLNLEKLQKKSIAKTEDSNKRSPYGVWIGNLSFDTTKEDLIRFIINKTDVKEEQLLRINIPKKDNKIKGFAYIDVENNEQVEKLVGLSEENLNGRNLLIKNSTSFEGRPEKVEGEGKNPPSRILFVGNLGFDTSEDNLREHFKHCGDITRIRMATFQDSGKCKGFAFVDFKDEEGAKNAISSKLCKILLNRKLRMEFGEDRSKKRPKKFEQEQTNTEINEVKIPQQRERVKEDTISNDYNRKRPHKPQYDNSAKRQKSSVALVNAQRASAAIVPSSGKKITFD
ncbi:unnamed protein product [Candida verbasci]|uniref:RRM domain-containing protein n=1 Tax=Candida verbasci TaxID=1227364 RepID=A0A9W4TW83_9ASCO|nr:unnamed protein product [Candida verbasci]